MRRRALLAATGLLLALSGCASEPAEPAAAPDGAATAAPAAIPSEVASNRSYWDEQRLSALEAAKAQFTPPPEETGVTADTAAPAPVVQESVAAEAPVAALTPSAEPMSTPVPSAEPTPTPDGKLEDEDFLKLVEDILDRYSAKELTTSQTMDALRALPEEEELTELQLLFLNNVVEDIQLILAWEQQDQQEQWNLGDIKLPTLYQVRRLMNDTP